MEIQNDIALGPKTTMRIGGRARYYAELETKQNVEEACCFAKEKALPLIVLGGGSNTVFADGTIEAIVVRIVAQNMQIKNEVYVEAGKTLAVLINELAGQNLDLSPLTGIPGTVGGAIFGNAGQGPGGTWIGHYIKEVTVFEGGGWHVVPQKECSFRYRESVFRDRSRKETPPILWSTTLMVPKRGAKEVQEEVERLLAIRIKTQPHLRTAGSCFKAFEGTPAWKLIHASNLRGYRQGDIEIAQKHANFLLNKGKGAFDDTVHVVETVREKVGHPLEVEMRFFREDGTLVF